MSNKTALNIYFLCHWHGSWVKVLMAKSVDLNSVLGIHMMERKNRLCPLTFPHVNHSTYASLHINKFNNLMCMLYKHKNLMCTFLKTGWYFDLLFWYYCSLVPEPPFNQYIFCSVLLRKTMRVKSLMTLRSKLSLMSETGT